MTTDVEGGNTELTSRKVSWVRAIESFGRIYRLALKNSCPLSCQFCLQVGGVSNQSKNLDLVAKHLIKAQTGGYQSILITCAKVELSFLKLCISQILEKQFTCVLQIRWGELQKLTVDFKNWLKQEKIFICIVVTSQDEINSEMLGEIYALGNYFYLYLPFRGPAASPFLLNIKNSEKEKIYFYFPIKTQLQDMYMSPKEVRAYVEKIVVQIENIKVKTLQGLDLYEPRALASLELEPILKPKLKKIKNKEQPLISIVIPSYNSCESLKYVLQEIIKQTFNPKAYEVIIVDDGSTDKTKNMIFDFLKKNQINMNFKYFYLPRPHARERGDHQYRAGVARNLGVKNSRGRFLLFIDSDILLPTRFLEQLLPLLDKHDVIQAKRLNFRPKAKQVSYESISEETGTYATDGGFLNILDHMPWQETPDKWKYVCTYCLCVKRDQFYELGWFRKSFCSYGFEDSELGYRLHKAGARFYYIQTPVLHFEPNSKRSEYNNSIFKKRRLLSHSAQTFYLLHPEAEVYRTLEWLWGDLRFVKSSIFLRVSKVLRKISLGRAVKTLSSSPPAPHLNQ